MKKPLFFLILLSISLFSFSQQGFLSYYPLRSTDILGEPQSGYQNFALQPAPLGVSIEDKSLIQIDSSNGATYATTFFQSLKDFSLPFFANSKFSRDSVWAKKVVYKSLRITKELSEHLNSQMYYVFGGISADSVIMRIKYDKKKFINFSDAVKTLSNIVGGIFKTQSVVNIVIDSVLGKVTKAENTKGDSSNLYLVIADPNVLYKIQMIKFSEFGTIGTDYTQKILPASGGGRLQDEGDFYGYPFGKTKSIQILIPYSSKAKQNYNTNPIKVQFCYTKPLGKSKPEPFLICSKPTFSAGFDTIFLQKDSYEENGRTTTFWQGEGLLNSYSGGLPKTRSNGTLKASSYLLKNVYYNILVKEVPENQKTSTKQIQLVHMEADSKKTYLQYPELIVEFKQ